MALLERDFVRVENDFTIIPNEILKNKEMKSSTKNILLTMFSLPPTWDFSIAGISKIVYEGKETVQKALVELEKIGYITRKRERKEGGTFGAMIYTIHQFPVSEDRNTYKKNFLPDQDVKNQKQVNPKQDSKTQLRTKDKSSTYCSNADNDNINSNLDNLDISSTKHNSFSNEKDNSKSKDLELYNSQVGELGIDALEQQESETEKIKSNITMMLGRKERPSKKHELQDMPTRAKEIAYRLTEDKELSDKAFDLVQYFMDKYKKHSKQEHLNLRNDTLERVVRTMLSTITVEVDGADGDYFENDYTPLVSYDVSPMDYEEVIDKYFATEFREDTDYSIVHFTNENVLPKIMNKCMLNGDHWYESHALY